MSKDNELNIIVTNLAHVLIGSGRVQTYRHMNVPYIFLNTHFESQSYEIHIHKLSRRHSIPQAALTHDSLSKYSITRKRFALPLLNSISPFTTVIVAASSSSYIVLLFRLFYPARTQTWTPDSNTFGVSDPPSNNVCACVLVVDVS